jgi:hypothetical protein
MRLVFGLVVLAVALVAAPAQAAVVAVTNSGLRDPQTRIFTGQRVAFTNLTGAAVAVDSTGRPSFDDLALAPDGDGERRFGRAGRYRYTAAGRDGVIIVRIPARQPRPGGGGSTSPRPGGAGCKDSRAVYRYDITVTGRKSVRETWRPEFRNPGDFSISYTYVVNYPGVWLSVTEDCGGGTTLDLPAGGAETAPGTGSLFGYTWSDSVRSAETGRPPPCAFATAVTGLGAEVSIEGFISRGVGGAFVSSRLTTPQFGVLESILSAKHGGVCNKDPGYSNAGVFDGLPGYDASADAIFSRDFTVSGGTLGPPNTGLHGDFSERQRRSPAMARKLARGRSFSVTTARIFDDTSSQTTAHGTASISISLRRKA